KKQRNVKQKAGEPPAFLFLRTKTAQQSHDFPDFVNPASRYSSLISSSGCGGRSMALRLGLGRIFGFFRPHWGIRGSLFVAFGVIAGMAIVISGGGGLALKQLGARMIDLSGRDIPRLSASLQLSALSASLAAQGPALLAAPDDDALKDRTKKLKELQQQTQQKLGEIIELGADKT